MAIKILWRDVKVTNLDPFLNCLYRDPNLKFDYTEALSIQLKQPPQIDGLSCISNFPNIQRLTFSIDHKKGFNNFDELQYVNFPKLKVLKLTNALPDLQMLIQFLKINGSNLIELYLDSSDHSLNSTIAEYCPNL